MHHRTSFDSTQYLIREKMHHRTFTVLCKVHEVWTLEVASRSGSQFLKFKIRKQSCAKTGSTMFLYLETGGPICCYYRYSFVLDPVEEEKVLIFPIFL